MSRLPLTRSLLFRSVVAYTALFCLAVTAVLALLYWSTLRAYESAEDADIAAEASMLERRISRMGITDVVKIVGERSTMGCRDGALYLLATQRYEYVAGNLKTWPGDLQDGPNLTDVPIEPGDPRAGSMARVRSMSLPTGHRLLVGEALEIREGFRRSILLGFVITIGMTLALGLGGGLFVSRKLLARLEQINRGSIAILEGDMSRRMPVGVGGNEMDVLSANLNRMLDRIDALVRGMKDVTDNVAHDMRSPLTRLRSRIEVALMQVPEERASREVLEKSLEDIDRILEIFNSLLTIAVAESGAGRDRFEAVDLVRVVRDTIELYEPAVEEAGLALSLRAPDSATLRGDPNLLSQALANLLENAIKYVPSGGRIEVEVDAGGALTRLTVADDGPGIPAESRENVLDRFSRLESSRSAPGSGLGLSLVRAVARLHEGCLRIDDNAPGLRVVLGLPNSTSTGTVR